MKTLKHYLCIGITIMLMQFMKNDCFGQWGTNGNDIYNTNSQRVGISNGASFNASNKLEVRTDTAVIDINSVSTVGQPTYGNPAIRFLDNSVAKYGIGLDANNNLKIASATNGVRITIPQTSGNVGIGTTAPNYLLEVSGGDIAAATSTNGYRIGTTYMLWHNNKAGSIYLGGAGSSSSSGTNNTLVGYQAGQSASFSGSNNTFSGYQAGYTNTTGANNSFDGYKAGFSNTTGGSCTFFGYQAGYTNSTASYCTYIGLNAGYGSTGANNTCLGYSAGQAASNSGTDNVLLGYDAGYSNTSGIDNTCVGSTSGFSNTTSSNNTYVGRNAGYTSTAASNTYVGHNAGYSTSTGGSNTAVGKSAGYTNTTGTNNTYLGYGADAAAACSTCTNMTAVGNGAIVSTSNTMYFGNSAVTTCINAPNSWTSDGRFKINIKENVKGLEFIKKLRPVTYQMKTDVLDDFLVKDMPDSMKAIHKNGMDFGPSKAIVHSGFIAQEVEKAAKNANFTSSIVVTPADSNNSTYALSYAEFVVPLVKAVQELSTTIDSLKTQSSAKKAVQNNDSILQRLAQLETLVNQCCTSGSSKQTGDNGDSGKNKQEIKLTLPDAATLGEAQPNPNNGSTQISYYLPQNISGAKIIFTDMLGKVMEEKPLQTGYGLLNIDTQNLPVGIYSYSLVIDGRMIDSKKMVRNK